MKKILSIGTMLVVALATLLSCSKFDDSRLWEAINKNAKDIAELKELCRQMNSDIKTLQTLVTALEDADYITNVSHLADGSGYSITLKKYGTIVIKNGEKGADGSNGTNGKDGENGKDGKDGKTPVISVAQDTDGIYYWTINGEWFKDEKGNKVKAVGIDGTNGQNGSNGNDGKTPQFDIREGYWYISYDGELWEKLGKASGENGLNGENGDAFFSGVSIREGYVIFYLNDSNQTELKLPFVTENKYSIQVDEAGTLADILPLDLCNTITQLKVSGNINITDFNYIFIRCRSLEILDCSDAETAATALGAVSNTTLTRLFLPFNSNSNVAFDLSNCLGLQDIIVNKNTSVFKALKSDISVIENLIIPEGTQAITHTYHIKRSRYFVLPSSLNSFSYQRNAYGSFGCSFMVIKAVNPPSFTLSDTSYMMSVYNKILVPRESITKYEGTDWARLASIAAMEDYGFSNE